MRITKVSVKKLFGIFDHEIPLNQESRITIVHGPNGVGKTVLFRMLDGLFSSRFSVFREIPFERFSVEFCNGSGIEVEQQLPIRQMQLLMPDDHASFTEWSRSSVQIVITHSHSDGTGIQPYSPTYSRAKGRKFLDVVSAIPELERIGSDRWMDEDTGEILSRADIIDTYDLDAALYGIQEPNWLMHINENIHIRFVQAQRLQSPADQAEIRNAFAHGIASVSPAATVERYSEEIARKIRNTIALYGQRSQEIDRSFPTRLMDTRATHQSNPDGLQVKLAELEAKSSELMELGLFERNDAPDIPKLDMTHEDLTNVLSVYVQDIEEKLSAFDEIATQLRLLTSIINERFQHKKLQIDKQKGFVIVATNDQRIPIASLSSGEQHELVLFYQLLFDVEPNSLILIDEPEISLHVTWQECFLEDIERASKSREFDVLIATHSPDIIGDRQDWMVGLGSPEMA